MGSTSNIGRIFFGIGIAGMGLLTVYYHDFPYMLLPPKHSWISSLIIVVYISGFLLILAGTCIVVQKKIRQVSLLLGTVLLLIFCLYFVPYQFTVSSDYMHLVDWENAEKELALAGGAFVIAGCFSEKNETPLDRFLTKLIQLGPILFSITMISFGILHFLYAPDVSDYVPSWVPNRLFWTYLAGTGLISSGLAIIFKIMSGVAAALLGTMIFIWFTILHIPRIIVAPITNLGSEVTSAIIALAYSGIAFVIAGASKKQKANQIYV